MAKAESKMLALGTQAPSFVLPDTISGKKLSFGEISGENGTLVMFICNHCPYVIHVNKMLVELSNQYKSKGIGFVAISSNDVENYPQDAPKLMTQHAYDNRYNFPYLYDATQKIARAYDAACTPDFYLFDADHTLVYRGRLCASRPHSDVPVTGKDLKLALNNLLAGLPIDDKQFPSLGCGIKWIR